MPATAYMQRRGVRRASRGARAAGAFARASLALLLFTAAAPGATAASRAPRHRIGEPVAAAAGVGAGPAAASSGGGGGLNASAAEPAAPLRWPWGPTADPVANVLALADCLYNRNNVSCIAAFCSPRVVVHGDGVFLPRTSFVGVAWAQELHSELFAAYSAWRHEALEVAATAGVKGFTEVFVFFRWTATNSGPYHGSTPSGAASTDYGIMRVATDKGGIVTDVTLLRGGFAEERAALLVNPASSDLLTPRRAITEAPFWVPSQSLQLKMVTRAHALLEVLNQGTQFLDGLDDLAVAGVELIDGTRMWEPPLASGLPALKLWFAAWLQAWGSVSAAATGSAVTASSNKVFLCFRLLLSPQERAPPSLAQVEGCFLAVFSINGHLTHLVVWRNGTPDEAAAKFIGGRVAGDRRSGSMLPVSGSSSSSGSSGGSSSTGSSSSSSSRTPGGNLAAGRHSLRSALARAAAALSQAIERLMAPWPHAAL